MCTIHMSMCVACVRVFVCVNVCVYINIRVSMCKNKCKYRWWCLLFVLAETTNRHKHKPKHTTHKHTPKQHTHTHVHIYTHAPSKLIHTHLSDFSTTISTDVPSSPMKSASMPLIPLTRRELTIFTSSPTSGSTCTRMCKRYGLYYLLLHGSMNVHAHAKSDSCKGFELFFPSPSFLI